MKKTIILILIILLVSAAAIAEDLSTMSYADLMDLRDRCQRELMTRPEWKQVTVPTGLWTVGIDIPAGEYTIDVADPEGYASILVWGYKKNDYETNGGMLICEGIGMGESILGKIPLENGNVGEISGMVIMMPVQPLNFEFSSSGS